MNICKPFAAQTNLIPNHHQKWCPSLDLNLVANWIWYPCYWSMALSTISAHYKRELRVLQFAIYCNFCSPSLSLIHVHNYNHYQLSISVLLCSFRTTLCIKGLYKCLFVNPLLHKLILNPIIIKNGAPVGIWTWLLIEFDIADDWSMALSTTRHTKVGI